MAFFSDINTEPKRNFRWLLYLGGRPTWFVKSTGKPKWSIDESKHAYLNHSFYYPGRVEWEPIDIVLIDPASPDASKTIQDILINSGYVFPLNPNNTSTISKARAVGALGQVMIQQIGAEGDNVIEEWNLVNAWVQKAEFGELAYENSDLTEIKLTIRYDYATMTGAGESVPA